MSLKLSKSGMGLDISVKFGEFSPLGSMTSSEERKKERIPRNTVVSWQLSCPDPSDDDGDSDSACSRSQAGPQHQGQPQYTGTCKTSKHRDSGKKPT